jgi:hypothetical protein
MVPLPATAIMLRAGACDDDPQSRAPQARLVRTPRWALEEIMLYAGILDSTRAHELFVASNLDHMQKLQWILYRYRLF